ncbi:MAG: type II toxin-antitoxin system RelE/ParE family toxin [Chitinophagaceae bacterium]|nr:type II toxin-antitoxin system RelE/ParE family toxin [Chitinophagaceae bacterium]
MKGFTVIPTSNFEKDAKTLLKKYPSFKQEMEGLFNSLATEPGQGIPLGKDCYKIRLSITSKGKGKSGGARIITCVKIIQQTVYLLSIFDKSEQDNISRAKLLSILQKAGLE